MARYKRTFLVARFLPNASEDVGKIRSPRLTVGPTY